MATRLRRSDVLRLLEEGDIHPSRALGQNFVIDPNVTERIARLARVVAGEEVLEIGAGLGSLTLALVAHGAHVTAVEIDGRLAEQLRRVVADAGAEAAVRVVVADAMHLDVAQVYGGEGALAPGSVTLVANLPYNVATPLVLRVLERAPLIGRLVVLVQKEVAERFAADPGSRVYGAVSARRAYFATAEILGIVSPEVFHPRPNVVSALVELRRRPSVAVDPELASYEEIATLIRLGFATRRKMLRRALAGVVDEAGFEATGIDPRARAEDLDVAAWGKLAAWRRSTVRSLPPS